MVYSLSHIISLPLSHLYRVHRLLSLFPTCQNYSYKFLWHHLLINLRILVIAIPGGARLFGHLQLALHCTGRIPLTPAVHVNLDDWRQLMHYLQKRPTHMLELVPPPLTWFGISDASNMGVGGILQGPDGHPRIWGHHLPADLNARLVLWPKFTSNCNINEFDLTDHCAHLYILNIHALPPS